MSDDIPMDDLMQSFLANESSLDLEDYLKRGRRFKEKEIGFLKERWVELLREMCNFDNTNKEERNDVQAEIKFRGEEPPFEIIMKKFDAFAEKMIDKIEGIEKEEPDLYDDANRDLTIEVANFLNQLKKPSN